MDDGVFLSDLPTRLESLFSGQTSVAIVWVHRKGRSSEHTQHKTVHTWVSAEREGVLLTNRFLINCKDNDHGK